MKKPNRHAHGRGGRKAERHFGVENLTDLSNMELLHHINQALKAQYMMKKDVGLCRTGRKKSLLSTNSPGALCPADDITKDCIRRLKQRTRVKVARESVTLATITFQNYFRMFKKLSGMTGTAKTEKRNSNHLSDGCHLRSDQ
jgi:preprotein translocase subunit SecA